jgi:methyl-accepting chemotaxis protein
MKMNLPVTNNEIPVPEGMLIVSKTNLKGIITDANEEFVRISGFARDELIGKNHNIVRHPDMPPAAFEDLWAKLKAGKPWQGLVKNRAKNGDYYWVEAHVTPITEGGQTVGYMSVRYAPTRAQIAEAEALYRRINEGQATFGARGPFSRLVAWFADWPIKLKLAALIGVLVLVLVGVAVVGLAGMGGARVIFSIVGLGVAFAVGFGYLLALSLSRPLAEAVRLFGEIAEGKFKNRIATDRNDEIGRVLQGLEKMQTRLAFEVNNTRQMAIEANRVRIGLDNASAAVMITDSSGRLIYLNQAMRASLGRLADAIRQSYPAFDPAQPLGADLGAILGKEKMHELESLAEAAGSSGQERRVRYALGGRTFDLIANPVFGDHGERLGLCVQWVDLTDELKMQEEEVQAVVQAALAGDLTRRVSVKDAQGFLRELGVSLNHLLSAFHESVEDFVTVMRALAQGDFTVRLAKDYQGLFRELQDDLNATVARLTEVVGRIQLSSEQVRAAAREIAAGNEDLSRRTQEQAAAIEETASAMEQMTATVKHNADNAQQARQLVMSARESASAGGEVVTQAIEAMERINASAKRIAEIIGVIDEIAFQTNLLALNAAVEAARAGESGRGFAVVAQEVRHLASRSAQAAKEIKALIQDSVAKVDAGKKLVDASGQALAQIVEGVKKVADIVAEIAAASQEQASGIEQVNRAVVQMDETTQQNAALVEQSSAAAKAMAEQAAALSELVAFFKFDQAAGETKAPGRGREATAAPLALVPGRAQSSPAHQPKDHAIETAAAKPQAVVLRADSGHRNESLKEQIRLAIAAHGKWKTRLKTAIETGQIDTPVEIIARDNQCVFGKWLYAPETTATVANAAGHRDYYQKVRDLHAKFHRSAARVVELALSGQNEEARSCLDTDYAAISSELTRTLMEWEKAA